MTDFRQNKPDDGKPVSRETIAWIAYDDQNFYAAFLCKEGPGKVRARMAKREDIFSDDEVALYLDTFHDKRHAFSFYVNPYGIQADSINTEGQDEDFSFDTVWASEGRITPDGYAVLIAVPFEVCDLRGPIYRPGGSGWLALFRRRTKPLYWPYYTNKRRLCHSAGDLEWNRECFARTATCNSFRTPRSGVHTYLNIPDSHR